MIFVFPHGFEDKKYDAFLSSHVIDNSSLFDRKGFCPYISLHVFVRWPCETYTSTFNFQVSI